MGKHPINLVFRFVLEMLALFSLGYLGWQADNPLRWLLVVLLPVGAAVLWGLLNVPDDPSRSGKAHIAVPGWLRLVFELVLFLGSAAGLYFVVGSVWGLVLAAAVIVHYAFSWDRVAWLLGADVVGYPRRP